MIKEIVWTPNEHKGKDLWNSPLWKDCYKQSEMTQKIRKMKRKWFVYHMKFDGIEPIQITKSEVK